MMKLELIIEKTANRKYAVRLSADKHRSIQHYETTNELFALYKSLQVACYENRFADFDVVTNSAAFAYELKHLEANRQRLAIITKQTLRRNRCTIKSAALKEID